MWQKVLENYPKYGIIKKRLLKDVLTLKNGLLYENGELIYYKDDAPTYAGIIKVDEDIYFIGVQGKALKGQQIVHGVMTNGIIRRGTYTFGEDYKLIPDSYIAVKVRKREKPTKQEKNKHQVSIWQILKSIEHKGRIIAALCMFVLIVLLFVVAGRYRRFVPQRLPSVTTTERETSKETENGTEEYATTGTVRITLPQYTEDVLLCTKEAKMEYDGEITVKTAINAGDPYRPFVFEYSFTNCSGTLLLGEREDLSDATQYALPESQTSITIHNLKVDTDYYYKVLVDGQEYLGNFHTALSTRYFYIPGVENTRDIGGATTLDGKRVKQGLLIRGAELDGLSTAVNIIPDDKLEEVQREYDFVYDMDLRRSEIYIGKFTSRLGVPQSFYYGPQHGEIFHKNFSAALKRIFSDLANPENYPMYLHCTWGQGRTGTVVFLLQGVLNMSEEDMVQEYRRSAYWESKMATSEDMRVITTGLEAYAGDTLQEKIVTFLITEIGVTEEEIASIRSIFLE